MTSIGAVFVSDRGDRYLPGCITSLAEHCDWDFHDTTIVDDHNHELGMAGAVQAAWAWALDQQIDYLLHIEEDFVFTAPVAIGDMVWILEHAPHLAQVVLKRQPWSPEEIAAGGIIETDPGAYTQCAGMRHSLAWAEHTQIFSLNPCLIPRRVLELGWPDTNEAGFTQRCIDNGYRFAFYGNLTDPPRVEHIGHMRGAGWRL